MPISGGQSPVISEQGHAECAACAACKLSFDGYCSGNEEGLLF